MSDYANQLKGKNLVTDARLIPFVEHVEPFVGKHVGVWMVNPFKPYMAGTFLRFAERGLLIAGHGIAAYWEIDRVTCEGREVRFTNWVES